MQRWLFVVLGLAVAAAAAWALLAPPPGGEPMGEIDDASRAKLERVLEHADE